MRKILLIIILYVCIDISFAYNRPLSKSDYNIERDVLSEILPDSVYSLLKNRPIILYAYGHYGYSWSLITRIDNHLQAFSGNLSYGGNRYLTEPTEFNQFDSVSFFSANASLLSWGFDTIPVMGAKMTPIKRANYITLYKALYVINSKGDLVFNSNDAVAFSGPDSIGFNERFNRLCLIMRWLSEPNIRQYIPDSLIY